MELIVFSILGFIAGWGGTFIVLEKRKKKTRKIHGGGWFPR